MYIKNYVRLIQYLTSNNIKEYLIKRLNKKNYNKLIYLYINYIKSIIKSKTLLNTNNSIPPSPPKEFSPGVLFIKQRKNFICILRDINYDMGSLKGRILKFFSTKAYRPFKDKTWIIYNTNKRQGRKNIENYKELQKSSKYRKNTIGLQKKIFWQMYFTLKSLKLLHVPLNYQFRGINLIESRQILNHFRHMSLYQDRLTGFRRLKKKVQPLTCNSFRILYQYPFNGCKARKKRRL